MYIYDNHETDLSKGTLYLNCIGSTGSWLVYPNNPKQKPEWVELFL